MPNNFMQTASFQAPTDYNVEAADIARRKALAQALQAQGMAPLGPTETVGGWAIPRSPMEGIGKMAQTLSGSYQEKKALDDERKLAESANQERQTTMGQILALGQGVPNLATDPSKLNIANLNTGTASDYIPELRAPVAQPTSPQQRNLLIAQLLSNSKLPDLRATGDRLMIEALTKENNPTNGLFQKVDAKDYTQTSVAKFAQTGNYADLVPVRKKEAVNAGGTTQFYDPYAEVLNPITHTVSADTNAKLAQQDKQFNSLSAYQQAELPIQRGNLAVAQGNLGVNRTNSYFNTGMGSPGGGGAPLNFAGPQVQFQQVGAPTSPQQPRPQMAPQPPQMPPQPNDGLTPAGRAAVAKDVAGKRAEAGLQLPQDLQTMQNSLDTLDKLVGNPEKGIPEHPGFQSLVGVGFPGLRYIPGTDTKGADKLLEQIGGQTFLQAYQSLRGGGQITEIEGAKATAALQRMDRAQSEKEFREAANDFRTNLIRGMQLAKQKAGVSAQPSYNGPQSNFVPRGSQIGGGSIFDQADAIIGRR